MSVKVMGMVWDHFPPNRRELVLALALADEADHEGGDIFPNVPTMATKTRQSERTVQRQLRALEADGWLECVQRSNGGRNRPSRFKVATAWMRDPAGFVFGTGNGDKLSPLEAAKRCQIVTVKDPETVTSATLNGDTAVSPACTRSSKALNPPPKSHIESGGTDAVEDRRLAEWILERIRRMHPKHRDPPWKRWCRDIRMLRERDKHTRREIADLFAWANADGFWQSNILSPAKLRDKWDQLEIRRGAAPPGQAKAVVADRGCAAMHEGRRCGKPGIRSDGNHANAPWYCGHDWERLEQQRAGCLT